MQASRSGCSAEERNQYLKGEGGGALIHDASSYRSSQINEAAEASERTGWDQFRSSLSVHVAL